MDGLATLAELRPRWPRLPVIMFSTLTERGAEATLEALSLGASDYVTKPTGLHNAAEAMAAVKAELVPRIKALHGSPAVVAARRTPPPLRPPRPDRSAGGEPPARPADARIDVVAIGVSTGGPNALAELLPAPAGHVSRADRDRAAHAAGLHPHAGQPPRRPVRRSG